MRNADRMSEADFVDRIIDTAHFYGWHVAHFRAANTGRGWRTPMQGDKGFPDLVLARSGRIIFAEVKSETGTFRKGQRKWLNALGGHARKWRPRDWRDVLHELSGGDKPDSQIVNMLIEEG